MANKKQVNWTDEEMRTIFDMRKSGASLDEIISEFPKRKSNAIKGKISRMGFSIAENKGGAL
tara:strand:- start:1094 stop:1279 length:186 start_codon:yes stop_codon:yes gene_type:complete